MIHQDILSGELKPGQKLVVAELKKRYNVGASPIREALVQLSWNKYITFTPQKGSWVAPISLNELTELFESLHTIGQVLLTKVILNKNTDWELNVLAHCNALQKIDLQTADLPALSKWETKHTDFYCALFSGAQSPIMFQFYQDISNQITRYRHLYHDPKALRDAYSEYLKESKSLITAILANDAEQACDYLRHYCTRSIALITPYFSA